MEKQIKNPVAMQIKLETKRLILREITIEDAPSLFRLDSDALVHRYLDNKPVQDMNQIRDIINFIREQYQSNGIGRWAVITKHNHEFIGWVGLKLVKEKINGHQHFFDLGYRLITDYWGKGYATEAANACLDYGFKQLKAKHIYAMVNFENEASKKVLQKLGMNSTQTIELEGMPHEWYEMSMENWRNKKSIF